MDSEFNALLGKVGLLDKIADSVRLVDPIRKQVLTYHNGTAAASPSECFALWDRDTMCSNCISMRAYNDRLTYVNIEYSKTKIHMITAVPYELDGKTVIFEMFKDMTDSLLIGPPSDGDSESTSVHTLIDNMNNLTYKNALTDIYNRRYIAEKLPVDLANAALLSQKLAVIITDIDHFKSVNDSYGHQTGDVALKRFAEVITGCVKRGSDWVARYGGEEFMICMPGAALEVAVAAAEKMRRTVEKTVIRHGETEIRMTASFGICCVSPDGSDSAEDIVKRADEKLYLAKINGRNRTEY